MRYNTAIVPVTDVQLNGHSTSYDTTTDTSLTLERIQVLQKTTVTNELERLLLIYSELVGLLDRLSTNTALNVVGHDVAIDNVRNALYQARAAIIRQLYGIYGNN